jgi:hypothetical protein
VFDSEASSSIDAARRAAQGIVTIEAESERLVFGGGEIER